MFLHSCWCGNLEGAREWGEVWVVSYSEEPQILIPHPAPSDIRARLQKQICAWIGEGGDGFSVSAFGTHMERCDLPVMAGKARPQQEKQLQAQTGITGKESKEHLTGNYRVVRTEGSQEGRRMSLPQTLSHACPRLCVYC